MEKSSEGDSQFQITSYKLRINKLQSVFAKQTRFLSAHFKTVIQQSKCHRLTFRKQRCCVIATKT